MDELQELCSILSVRFDADDRRGTSLRVLEHARRIDKYGALGSKSDAELELYAMSDGWQLALDRGLRFLLIEGD